ncbi:3-mercaptopyruvate sulfurtransferase [Sulfurifustis variabilis]|uniref:3-mercaptopyruvate sulfurtransferase n=1 Tax=Sulfurifustis variabilis TaxID=1675686 RepID=A0A1B4VBY1_9GAMM|nr:sulfurtransferase [Sulfurifustis variabilis]BAU48501.1 3-mercaptopyruvate sulfurtransferase [Sulfurifustis variabilis]
MAYTTLITTGELADHLEDPGWAVFDCRFILTDPGAGRRAYAAGHIPSARYAHLNEDLSGPVTASTGRHPLPDPGLLAEKLGRWGVDQTTQVVAYDDSYGAMAARLWWLLRWLGHDAVAVLDGDLRAWSREKRPLTTAEPVVTPRIFTPRIRADAWLDSAAVERLVQTGDGVLLDARAEERFRGEVEPFDRVAGHVPGAISLPFEDNLQPSGRFLPPEELRGLYHQALGDIPADRVAHMCGSGVTACHNLLAMEHAGLAGARLYVGSWSEWITDPRRPIARGD